MPSCAQHHSNNRMEVCVCAAHSAYSHLLIDSACAHCCLIWVWWQPRSTSMPLRDCQMSLLQHFASRCQLLRSNQLAALCMKHKQQWLQFCVSFGCTSCARQPPGNVCSMQIETLWWNGVWYSIFPEGFLGKTIETCISCMLAAARRVICQSQAVHLIRVLFVVHAQIWCSPLSLYIRVFSG